MARPRSSIAALERMIRVDHAGEYGAARIYDGQLAVLGRAKSAGVIRHMAEQEKRHLAEFDELTGRANRRQFRTRIAEACRATRERTRWWSRRW